MSIIVFVSDNTNVDLEEIQENLSKHFPEMKIGEDIVIHKLEGDISPQDAMSKAKTDRECFALEASWTSLSLLRQLVNRRHNGVLVVDMAEKTEETNDGPSMQQMRPLEIDRMRNIMDTIEFIGEPPLLYRPVLWNRPSPDNIRGLPRGKKHKKAMAHCRNWKTGRK